MASAMLKVETSSEEDHVKYLQRTAGRIKDSMEKYKLKPIHVQILSAYFRAAFHEAGSEAEPGFKYLLGARLFRDRLAWEASKNFAAKRRRFEKFLQRTQGPKETLATF